jgi:hypothetical protein
VNARKRAVRKERAGRRWEKDVGWVRERADGIRDG